MAIFNFQVITDTRKEAKRFMERVNAQDVDIEEWEYNVGTANEISECYGFARTNFSPKRLQRIADFEAVGLAYVNKAEAEDQPETI